MHTDARGEPNITSELEAALQRRRQLSASPAVISPTKHSPLATRNNIIVSERLCSPCGAAPQISPTCEPSELRRDASTPKNTSTTPSQIRRSTEVIQPSPPAYTKVDPAALSHRRLAWTRLALSQRRQSDPLLRAAAAATAAADAPPAPQRPKLVTEDWQKVLDLQKAGDVVGGTIKALNRGGAVVELKGVSQLGFVPFSRMDATRLPEDAATKSTDMAHMVGEPIKTKIIQVNVPERKLILSERAAMLSELIKLLKPGDEVEGVVTRTTDYGAFVSLVGSDGRMHGAEGMIHISELSWDVVMTPESVVQQGTPVRCAVLDVNVPKARISLSLKRMQEDPLQETLDAMLPPEARVEGAGASATWNPARVPQGVEDVCEELRQEPGIDAVTLGRQVQERRTVSQDLELWISKEPVEGGYNLVARAGRTVQEVLVSTQLPLDGMKDAMQRVLRRLI